MTTSLRKSYNYLALRGANVDDMEYVEQFNLPAEVAYTPRINEVMLDKVYEDNLASGLDEQTAMKNRANAATDIKNLLAKNGML